MAHRNGDREAVRGGRAPAPDSPALQGTLDRVVYANEETGWCVVRLQVPGRRDLVTAVGSLLGAQPGERLRLVGRWTTDAKYGEQFRAEAFTTLAPATLLGIERYLGSGLVRGVGPKMAARLVGAFGLETLDVIERAPERLVEVAGIGPVRAGRIRAAWAEQKAIREVMVFLQGHGLSPTFAVRIYRHYRDHAVAVVRENPYRLAEEIRGIGFRTADRIARRLDILPDAPARLRAGIVYTLNRFADQGHVHAEREALVEAAAQVLREAAAPAPGGAAEPARGEEGEEEERVAALPAAGAAEPTGTVRAEAVAAELDGLVAEERLVQTQAGGRTWVALPALDAAERGVVSGLRRIARGPLRPLEVDAGRALEWYERVGGITLAPLQREAIIASLSQKVLVITGGPGTGKTTLLRAIVEIHARKGRRVALCAPTGRAAQRLGEATGREAKTIHRLLEVDPKAQRFTRDDARPLEADLIVADECSMIDVVLCNSLCKAVPAAAQLVLVGDADQLPSVGPGNVLGDLIASATVPVVRLTEVFRQAQESRIVRSAHRILRGETPLRAGGRDDFFWVVKEDPEQILAMCRRLVARDIPRRFGFDPARDVQVLTPMRRGLLGAGNLNAELQALLNPRGREVRGGRGLRVGDKVMQVENDYERDVFNGDLGTVAGADEEEGAVRVRFGEREVAYDARDLDALALAYACSVHKAQGSEYPAVVIPLHTQHYLLLQRRLLYTAVTRGRKLVVVVGSRRAMAIALRNRAAAPRNTQLAERLARAWGARD